MSAAPKPAIRDNHVIGKLRFDFAVSSADSGMADANDLAWHVRSELLPEIEAALDGFDDQGRDIYIDELEIDLDRMPARIDWTDLRLEVREKMAAALERHAMAGLASIPPERLEPDASPTASASQPAANPRRAEALGTWLDGIRDSAAQLAWLERMKAREPQSLALLLRSLAGDSARLRRLVLGMSQADRSRFAALVTPGAPAAATAALSVEDISALLNAFAQAVERANDPAAAFSTGRQTPEPDRQIVDFVTQLIAAGPAERLAILTQANWSLQVTLLADLLIAGASRDTLRDLAALILESVGAESLDRAHRQRGGGFAAVWSDGAAPGPDDMSHADDALVGALDQQAKAAALSLMPDFGAGIAMAIHALLQAWRLDPVGFAAATDLRSVGDLVQLWRRIGSGLAWLSQAEAEAALQAALQQSDPAAAVRRLLSDAVLGRLRDVKASAPPVSPQTRAREPRHPVETPWQALDHDAALRLVQEWRQDSTALTAFVAGRDAAELSALVARLRRLFVDSSEQGDPRNTDAATSVDLLRRMLLEIAISAAAAPKPLGTAFVGDEGTAIDVFAAAHSPEELSKALARIAPWTYGSPGANAIAALLPDAEQRAGFLRTTLARRIAEAQDAPLLSRDALLRLARSWQDDRAGLARFIAGRSLAEVADALVGFSHWVGTGDDLVGIMAMGGEGALRDRFDAAVGAGTAGKDDLGDAPSARLAELSEDRALLNEVADRIEAKISQLLRKATDPSVPKYQAEGPPAQSGQSAEADTDNVLRDQLGDIVRRRLAELARAPMDASEGPQPAGPPAPDGNLTRSDTMRPAIAEAVEARLWDMAQEAIRQADATDRAELLDLQLRRDLAEYQDIAAARDAVLKAVAEHSRDRLSAAQLANLSDYLARAVSTGAVWAQALDWLTQDWLIEWGAFGGASPQEAARILPQSRADRQVHWAGAGRLLAAWQNDPTALERFAVVRGSEALARLADPFTVGAAGGWTGKDQPAATLVAVLRNVLDSARAAGLEGSGPDLLGTGRTEPARVVPETPEAATADQDPQPDTGEHGRNARSSIGLTDDADAMRLDETARRIEMLTLWRSDPAGFLDRVGDYGADDLLSVLAGALHPGQDAELPPLWQAVLRGAGASRDATAYLRAVLEHIAAEIPIDLEALAKQVDETSVGGPHDVLDSGLDPVPDNASKDTAEPRAEMTPILLPLATLLDMPGPVSAFWFDEVLAAVLHVPGALGAALGAPRLGLMRTARLVDRASAQDLDHLVAALSQGVTAADRTLSALLWAALPGRFMAPGLRQTTMWQFILLKADGAFPRRGGVSGLVKTALEWLAGRSVTRPEMVGELLAVLTATRPVGNAGAVAQLIAALRSQEGGTPAEAMDDEETPAAGAAAMTQTAGLVLLSPYLPRLFQRLNLTEGAQFRGKDQTDQALDVLHALAFGQSAPTTAPRPLERLLCGVPRDVPLRPVMPVNAEAREMVDGLLGAVVQQWKALGGTSVDGLRQSFLMREGLIETKDGTIRLKVAPKPYDMLLDRLPWSFNIVKFAWMEVAIHVDWRSGNG